MSMWKYFGVAVVVTVLIAACSHTPAPVEDLSARQKQTRAKLSNDGNYTVRGGDTLYSIAFDYGLDWKDVASWNGIGRPYTIYPGQALRLSAPATRTPSTAAVTTRPVGSAPSATTRAADPATPRSTTVDATPASSTTAQETSAPASNVPASPAPTTSSRPAPASSAPPAATSTATTASTTTAPPSGPLSDPKSWLWPTEGRVVGTFKADDPSRKGLDIAGDEGQPIIASATGDVVYSGNGLIGFGELIIIKHSESMLTAYAHNRRRLVEEGQRVTAGSKIAEMGQNGQNQTVLHFELRVNGRPVDPTAYLPGR